MRALAKSIPAPAAQPTLKTSEVSELNAPTIDLELEIAKAVLIGSKLLTAALKAGKGPSSFIDRNHLLATVAIVGVASNGGDTAKAAAAMGILANGVNNWLERAETALILPGLKKLLTDKAAVTKMHLPEIDWPSDLSLATWNTLPIEFKPKALSAMMPKVTPPAPKSEEPSRVVMGAGTAPAKQSAAAAPKAAPKLGAGPKLVVLTPAAAEPNVATSPAVQWLRAMVANAYLELKRFSDLESAVLEQRELQEQPPSFMALKGAHFWQAFAMAKGSSVKLMRMFPNDQKFVEDQLECMGRLKGVRIDPVFFASAFEVAGSPQCQVHTSLPNVIELSAIEKRLEAVYAAKPSAAAS